MSVAFKQVDVEGDIGGRARRGRMYYETPVGKVIAWIDYRFAATVSIAADERWHEVPAVDVSGTRYKASIQVTFEEDGARDVRNFFVSRVDTGKEAPAAVRKRLRSMFVSLADTILAEHPEEVRDLRERALLIRLEECQAQLDELARKREQLLDRQAALQADLLRTIAGRPKPEDPAPLSRSAESRPELLPPQLPLFS